MCIRDRFRAVHFIEMRIGEQPRGRVVRCRMQDIVHHGPGTVDGVDDDQMCIRDSYLGSADLLLQFVHHSQKQYATLNYLSQIPNSRNPCLILTKI